MGQMLDATTTTDLTRTTVHAQYNRRAFGVVIFNSLIPIVLHVPKPGRCAEPKILVFGGKHHDKSPYKDYGVRRKCCRKVLLFNMIHFQKCYLTDDESEGAPYTFNCCRKCGATLTDACGHLVQFNQVREYRVNKYIFKASTVLQEDGQGSIFNFQKGNC